MSLKALQATQQTLSTEKGLGTIAQASNAIHADQALLSKEETAGASKQAINDTKGEIKILQSHVLDLKTVNSKITKTEDTLNQMNTLRTSLQTVKSAQDEMRSQISTDLHATSGDVTKGVESVHSAIAGGIKITDLPPKNTRASGSVHMSVS